MNSITVKIPNSGNSLLKSFKGLVSYQNNFFDEVNFTQDISENILTNFDLDISDLKIYQNRAENLLLTYNPYSRDMEESLSDWKSRSNDVHNHICKYKKIIATSEDAYKGVVFKHSQKIYFSEFPKSLNIYKDRLNSVVSLNGRIVYVVDYHQIYQSNLSKITGNSLIDIVQIKESNDLTSHEYLKIITAKSIYWMSENTAIYESIVLSPEILSLSGVLVNIKKNSKFTSYNGFNFHEILSGMHGILKNKIQNRNINNKDNQNVIINFLRNHL